MEEIIMSEALTLLMTNCIKTHAVALLPIYQIDNVSVVVHIWYSRTDTKFSFHYGVYAPSYNWTFLETKQSGSINDDNTEVMKERILKSQKITFMLVLKLLKNMRMNYYSGKLDLNNIIHPNLHKDFRDLYKDTPSVKIGEDCCVCYTSTTTYTNCKHCICWECLAKLIPNEKTKPNCPLCRRKIKFILNPREVDVKEYDEDEDEDED